MHLNKRYVLLWVLFAALLVVLFLDFAVWHGVFSDKRSITSLREISDLTSVEFPHGAELMNSLCIVGFFDELLLANVRIGYSDVGVFLSSLPRNTKCSTKDKLGIDSPKCEGYGPISETVNWWDPAKSRKFLAYVNGNNKIREPTLRVLLNKDNSSYVIIYVRRYISST